MTESVFSQAEREAARKRCEAATEGPWERYGFIGQFGLTRVRAILHRDQTDRVIYSDVPSTEDDSAFIVHARMDLPAALDELDLRDKEREEKDQRIAWLEEENARLGQAISVGKLQLEDDITDLRKAVAERDEAMEFMAKDKRPICVATIYGGGCIAYHHTTDEEIGRGPTPLAAIQDAMKKGGAK